MKYPFLSVLAIAAITASASAETAIKNISTGYDDANNVQLNAGDVDTDWAIVPGGTGGHVGDSLTAITNVPSPWLPDSDSSASHWIALNTGSGTWGIDTVPGTYLFQTSVLIDPSVDISTVAFTTLRFAADDKVLDIQINGTSVYSPSCPCPDYATWTTLDCVGHGLFTAGANQITFIVNNGTSDALNPMGLRVEGTVAEGACGTGNPPAVPEPATAGLVGLSSLALLVRFRRKTA